MTDLLTYINVNLLGLKPFHLNVVKVPLITLSILTVIWLLVDRRAGQRLASWSSRFEAAPPKTHRYLAFVLIAVWTAFLCFLKIQQHVWMKTGIDLAIYTNVAWHMVHGPIFYDAILYQNILGGHFSPIYLVIGAFYRLYEHPATLMVIQSLGLGVGAIALYLIALRHLGRSVWAVVVLLLYLSHSYLHIAHHIEFHTNLLAIPTLLWMLYFVDRGNQAMVLLLAALALSIEEVLPPAVVGVGLYLAAFRPGMRIVGWVCAVTAAVYFVVVVGIVMPAINQEPGGHLLWVRYSHLGASFGDALLNIALHPFWALGQALMEGSKWYYVLAFFGSLAFIPLLAWRQVWLTAPPLLMMLFNQSPSQYKLGFHYSATALPLLYYGLVYGMGKARELLRNWLPAAENHLRIACGILALLVGFNVSQSPGYDLAHVDPPYVTAARTAISAIPDGASVAGSGYIVAQLANRHLICYIAWEPGKLCKWGAPEFVILELTEENNARVPQARQYKYLETLVTDLGYTVVQWRNDIVVLHGQERLGPEFAPTTPDYSSNARSGRARMMG